MTKTEFTKALDEIVVLAWGYGWDGKDIQPTIVAAKEALVERMYPEVPLFARRFDALPALALEDLDEL